MRKLKIVFALAIIAAALLAAEPALAQCPMCKATVENAVGGGGIAGRLNLAILILLVPPVAIFAGLFALFYRYRNLFGSEARSEPETRERF
ncbi:MAG TPA: hypothetical protein VIG62_19695 [Blastocatellia bacterium]|jgi:hypothetical protein